MNADLKTFIRRAEGDQIIAIPPSTEPWLNFLFLVVSYAARLLSEAHAPLTILYVRSGADASKLYLDENLVPHGVFQRRICFARLSSYVPVSVVLTFFC
jgi:hypothetical protein